jgi:hypothetical protein
MKPYAHNTDVTVEKSKMQIERLLKEFKASSIMTGTSTEKSMIAFAMADRHVKFVVPMPKISDFPKPRFPDPRGALERATRTRWRALYLALRGKLEMAATGITSFEDEFLAHIIMPDGRTVAEHIKPRIGAIYESGEVRPLLESPRS